MALSESNADYRLPHRRCATCVPFTFAKLERRHGFTRISRIFLPILIRENPRKSVAGFEF